MKKILDMTSKQAKKYFLKNSSYFSMELPTYINFSKLLQEIDNKIGSKNIVEFYKNNMKPENYDNVNYKFNHNKNGKYAWRTLQLIHPFLYVNLVNLITKEENWNLIKCRFNEFKKNKKIVCCSDIIESSSKKKDKGAAISSWWTNVEQESIKLALQYNSIGNTDISNCYGSIYTHSISWALYGIEYSKQHREISLFGNKIDKELRIMSYGQTNGIPQGSTLMDFIAEIVLGYGDILISTEIEKLKIKKYKILRYRDDYRIFAESEDIVAKILKIISEQLSVLNFQLNPQKTIISNDVITNSIKEDKLDSIVYQYNDIINIQNMILAIRQFSMKYPNSNRIKKILNDVYIEKIEKMTKKSNRNKELISLIVDIMYNNTGSYQVCSAILSKLLAFESKSEKNRIISLIENKFLSIPNTDYLSIWLQRITIFDNNKKRYNSKICQMIYNSDVHLWNSNWLNFDLNENLIVDKTILGKVTKIIPSEELKLFDEYN